MKKGPILFGMLIFILGIAFFPVETQAATKGSCVYNVYGAYVTVQYNNDIVTSQVSGNMVPPQASGDMASTDKPLFTLDWSSAIATGFEGLTECPTEIYQNYTAVEDKAYEISISPTKQYGDPTDKDHKKGHQFSDSNTSLKTDSYCISQSKLYQTDNNSIIPLNCTYSVAGAQLMVSRDKYGKLTYKINGDFATCGIVIKGSPEDVVKNFGGLTACPSKIYEKAVPYTDPTGQCANGAFLTFSGIPAEGYKEGGSWTSGGNGGENGGSAGGDLDLGDEAGNNCSDLIGNLQGYIQTAFDWIRIIAPIALILFGGLDFGQAVIANDNDALKKAGSKFMKRAIAAVAIFFVPTIINLLFSLPGLEGFNITDAVCGIK